MGYTTCADAASHSETVETNTPDVTSYYDNVTNAKGKMIKVTSSVSTTEYTSFDILGRVTASKQTTDGVTYGNGTTDSPMTYTYNLGGAMVEQQYPSGRVVKNVLDSNGDLAIVQSKKNSSDFYHIYANDFVYNAAGAASSLKLGNGKFESTQFNSRLQPTQIALGASAGDTGLLRLDYTYSTSGNHDNNGNLLTQTITVPTVGSNSGFVAAQSYTYDSLNRLLSATENVTPTGGSASQSWKQEFSYDRYGNKNYVTGSGHTTTIPSGCSTAVCNPSYNTSNNRFASGQTWAYDSSGNITTDANSNTFTYDGENKQVEVKNSSSVSVGQYYYDGDGKRVKKYVPATGETTIFVYDVADKLVAEYSTVVANSTDAKVNYLTNDHLGSPRINTDANGAVISRHDYMPFGEEVTSSLTSQRSSSLNYSVDTVRKQFTGYERDIESELDFAQARYYNPMHGRFTSVDPITASEDIINPQTFNRYAYVGNNPLNITDPTGEMWGVSGTSIQWFDTEDAMKKAGFTAYSALVAVIAGTNQMVALNPNANAYVQVAGATAAIEQLAGWGASAEALAASGAVTGIGAGAAIAIAMAYVETYLPENFVIDNRPEQVMGYSVSKRQMKYFQDLADKMSQVKANESNPSMSASGESSPADPNSVKPDPDDDKPHNTVKDITKGNSVPNTKTDASKGDFIKNLEENGYQKTVSKDGHATILTKGARRYVLRDKSNEGSPTADVYRGGKLIRKIRLTQ